MKNILIATDFSDNALHAARYGYGLACKLKTNIILCNAFLVPAELPEAGMVIWPQYEYDDLVKEGRHELRKIKSELEKAEITGDFKPEIDTAAEAGNLGDVIAGIAGKNEVGLIVAGTHGGNALNTLMLGSHAKKLIEETTLPLLLVPRTTLINRIKNITFATDFEEPGKDAEAIRRIVPLLNGLDCILELLHVGDERDNTFAASVLTDIALNAGYQRTFYKLVNSRSFERGVEMLSYFGDADVVAVVHRKPSLLDRLFGTSHTQKIAIHTTMPLLILPEA